MQSARLWAQDNFSLDIKRIDGESLTDYKTGFSTVDKLDAELRRIINVYKENGYYAASIDSLRKDSIDFTAFIYVGEPIKKLKIDLSEVPDSIKLLQRALGSAESEQISFSSLALYQDRWLKVLENNGYPFASVQLKDTEIVEGEARGALLIDTHNKIHIDSLVLKGPLKMSKRFLQNYFDIHPDGIYSEEKNQRINDRIKELPYASATRVPYVEFIEDRASIYVFMAPRNASQFDVVLGLLPRSAAEGGGFEISGEGELRLWNALKQGEKIELSYKNYPASAQQLDAGVYYPYLPYLPLGLDASFNLYIRDTLFIDRKLKIGFQYNLSGHNYVKLFLENEKKTLLSLNTAQIIQTKSLPENLDSRVNNYGIALHYENLDYKYNPTKGWLIHTEVSTGRKEIPRNGSILDLVDSSDPEFDFETLYDGINERNNNTNLSLELNRFWKIGSQSTLLTGIRAAYISSDNIFQNDLYRIGGNRLLRGFDEETIFTDSYGIATAEYRYLIGQNSYFNAFVDQAYRQNILLESNNSDWPVGFGIGFNFETSAGIFGLSYALGRELGNPINFRTGKIHFGYANLF